MTPHTSAAHRARRWSLALLGLLAACTAVALLRSTAWPLNVAWTALLLAPLALPVHGLLRGDRRTYAWATLCIAPYLMYGLTESVANPAVRVFAGAILVVSIALFAALVAFLRITRPRATSAQEP